MAPVALLIALARDMAEWQTGLRAVSKRLSNTRRSDRGHYEDACRQSDGTVHGPSFDGVITILPQSPTRRAWRFLHRYLNHQVKTELPPLHADGADHGRGFTSRYDFKALSYQDDVSRHSTDITLRDTPRQLTHGYLVDAPYRYESFQSSVLISAHSKATVLDLGRISGFEHMSTLQKEIVRLRSILRKERPSCTMSRIQ